MTIVEAISYFLTSIFMFIASFWMYTQSMALRVINRKLNEIQASIASVKGEIFEMRTRESVKKWDATKHTE